MGKQKFGLSPEEIGFEGSYDKKKFKRGPCLFPYITEESPTKKDKCFEDEKTGLSVCPTSLHKDKKVKKIGVCFDMHKMICEIKSGKSPSKSTSNNHKIVIDWFGSQGRPVMKHPPSKSLSKKDKYYLLRKKIGYAAYYTNGDGNCLFHSIVGSIMMDSSLGQDFLDTEIKKIEGVFGIPLDGESYSEKMRYVFILILQNQDEVKNYYPHIYTSLAFDNDYLSALNKLKLEIDYQDIIALRQKQIDLGWTEAKKSASSGSPSSTGSQSSSNLEGGSMSSVNTSSSQGSSNNPNIKPNVIDLDVNEYIASISYYYQARELDPKDPAYPDYDLSARDIIHLNKMIEYFIEKYSNTNVYTDEYMARAVCSYLKINLKMYQVQPVKKYGEPGPDGKKTLKVVKGKYQINVPIENEDKEDCLYEINIHYNGSNHYEAMKKFTSEEKEKYKHKSSRKKKKGSMSPEEPKKKGSKKHKKDKSSRKKKKGSMSPEEPKKKGSKKHKKEKSSKPKKKRSKKTKKKGSMSS